MPSKHQVEAWKLPFRQIETSLANPLRTLRRLAQAFRFFTLDAMHLLRIHWGFGEHRFRGHPKIAFCVIRGIWRSSPKKNWILPQGTRPADGLLMRQPVSAFGVEPPESATEKEPFSRTAPSPPPGIPLRLFAQWHWHPPKF